jgi:hypothetical protein
VIELFPALDVGFEVEDEFVDGLVVHLSGRRFSGEVLFIGREEDDGSTTEITGENREPDVADADFG